mgnify:CR=1 FL=1
MTGISIYTDGASRGNPGEAAIGAVIFDGKEVVAELKRYLGKRTNNWAEYEAVSDALIRAKELNLHGNPIRFFLDSKLVAEQLSGNWKIKEATLREQNTKIHKVLEDFSDVTFTHIPREKNTHADRLANEALDHQNL